ncbi:hypothetical protein C1646_678561 [Rhizophagus diaphanus]|nr:hypothetical protein C1646_678561 [Rhizophagus diaphanus] [Rhizophagus sp. MUCL 43196]
MVKQVLCTCIWCLQESNGQGKSLLPTNTTEEISNYNHDEDINIDFFENMMSDRNEEIISERSSSDDEDQIEVLKYEENEKDNDDEYDGDDDNNNEGDNNNNNNKEDA